MLCTTAMALTHDGDDRDVEESDSGHNIIVTKALAITLLITSYYLYRRRKRMRSLVPTKRLYIRKCLSYTSSYPGYPEEFSFLTGREFKTKFRLSKSTFVNLVNKKNLKDLMTKSDANIRECASNIPFPLMIAGCLRYVVIL